MFKNQQLLKTFFSDLNEGVLIVDAEGTILFFNKAAEKITGYSFEEVLGKDCSLLDSDTYIIHNGAIQKRCPILIGRDIIRKNCHMKRKDGTKIHVLKSVTPIKDLNDKIIGGIELMVDMTSLKRWPQNDISEQSVRLSNGFMGIIGNSPIMLTLYKQIKMAASSDASVIICGETGTGKELIANAIHALSNRRDGPFVKVNCAALPETLIESELFGHVKGAFTGAIKDRKGKFEEAHEGTLFLDEIGEMSNAMQSKLLRVLQEKEIVRLGDNKVRKVDVRIITATNKNICAMLQRGDFREDLFYRINIFPIHSPALRDHAEDIPLLVEYFLSHICNLNAISVKDITDEVRHLLYNYKWPGNIRQLINVLEYAVIASMDAERIDISHMPMHILSDNMYVNNNDMFKIVDSGAKIAARHELTREVILAALQANSGSRTAASRTLGVSRVTLWKKMREMGIA
ncbi:MAG: sigma 54-interacting transcriptional regulator [Dissulfuribacterales bacterium]